MSAQACGPRGFLVQETLTRESILGKEGRMRVDMHAHYVPPRILEVLERDAAPYGVQIQHAEGGGRCLHFGAGVTLRPFHRTRSGSENRNHAAACDSSVPAGSRDGGASPRKAAS